MTVARPASPASEANSNYRGLHFSPMCWYMAAKAACASGIALATYGNANQGMQVPRVDMHA